MYYNVVRVGPLEPVYVITAYSLLLITLEVDTNLARLRPASEYSGHLSANTPYPAEMLHALPHYLL